MTLLAHETYGESQHFWYQESILQEHDYGLIFNHHQDWIDNLVKIILSDISLDNDTSDYFWYFGPKLENMVLMVRYKDNHFDIQINVKDFDFALHLDLIKDWKEALLMKLQEEQS
ncbi:hypothetical protein MX003_04730 [Streptococcus uberis]|uniref:hypothetical protein n=1 Tax=Streptococcus uberis TaxID=1349 RepID=UPI0027DE670F|nr:hypothetical protein [Streptococcus uberis]MCK1236993.1 hypothetical protein [Streptococcus uberis]